MDERTWVLSGASPCARGKPGANQDDHTEDLAYHNHGFYACVAEAASHACAHVPEMLDQLGRLMAASRQPGHVIRDALVAGWKADHPSTEPPWGSGQPGYKFIYDRYCQTGGSLDVDFDGLMEQLSDRKANRGLPFFLDHNPQTLRVNRMYVALAGGVEEWSVGGEDNVLLFDPTWGTNLYRWKLCMIATVAATGETVLIAYALLEEETMLGFEWVFGCVSSHLVVPPKVVFSDHDDKIETALRRMQVDAWPDHLHFLCVYHISKNVFQHLRGLFLADGGGVLWKAVFDRFWKITKNTDSSYRDTFDADWGKFVDMVRDTASNKDKLPAELRWLTTLGSSRVALHSVTTGSGWFTRARTCEGVSLVGCGSFCSAAQ